MESLINYYYGLDIISSKKINDGYLIETNNGIFLFTELYDDAIELQRIINILNNTDIKYHLLVISKDNNLYITYEERNYCLLKVRCNLEDKMSLMLFNKVKVRGSSNWQDVWSKRIDYYESQVLELIKEPSIKYALQYYIGITEIAIYYCGVLKEIYSDDDLTYCVSHKRIESPVKALDFYNPLNMLVDLEVRDLAEYFKASFFNETLTDYELLSLIDKVSFSEPMANYLFLRLLYPSYFFYLYDDYIETKKVDDRLVLYIKKSKDYESLLSGVYSRLSLNNDIKIKLWFFKVQHL
jgi:hypothetical protein